MKKIFIPILTLLLVFGGCANEETSPIDGVWQLVYGKWRSGETYPGQITGSGVKVWTKGNFAFAGEFQLDTVSIDNYGWGNFRFVEGTKYEETILLHHSAPGLNGKTIKMLMELSNDTLIQMWPTDENWNLEERHSIEKYLRLK